MVPAKENTGKIFTRTDRCITDLHWSAEKGYSIVTGGLNTIKNIKHGDFNLHNKFFSSLATVNPSIKKHTKVVAIIAMQISIAKQVTNAIKFCKKSNMLLSAELKYLNVVFNNLLGECAKNLDELFALITNNETQMKDDERIQRIDKLYEDMKDKQCLQPLSVIL